MHFFDFQADKSWVTVRKRRLLFKTINKIVKEYGKFVFLPSTPDTLQLDAGWRDFVDEEWKQTIYIPAKPKLND